MYQSLSEEHADGRDRVGELEPEHSEAARDQELNAEPRQAHNQPALPLDRPQEPASSCAKSATLRFVSATPLLAILSLLITCFATAYPHWVTYAGSNGYIGLWRYCYSNAGEDEVCSEIGDSHCAHSGCGVIDGLRALMVLAILFNALVLLLSAAYYFWPPSPYSQADCDHLCCFFRFCERPHTGGEESLEADLALLLEVHGPAAIQQPARLAAILVQSRALLHGEEPRPWSALLPTYYPRCLQQLASLLQALCLFFALCLSPVQLAWWAQAQPDAPVHVGACPLVTIVPLLLSAGYSAALFIALRRWRAFSVQPFPQAHLLLPNALAAAGAAALGPPVQVAEVA